MATSRHYQSTSPVTGSGGASQQPRQAPQRRSGQAAGIGVLSQQPAAQSGQATQPSSLSFTQQLLAQGAQDVAGAHQGTDASLLRSGDWDALLGRLGDIFGNRGVGLDYYGTGDVWPALTGETEQGRLERMMMEVLTGQRTFDDVRGSVDQLAAQMAGVGVGAGIDMPPPRTPEEAQQEIDDLRAAEQYEVAHRDLAELWAGLGMTPEDGELQRFAESIAAGQLSASGAAVAGAAERIARMWEHYGLDLGDEQARWGMIGWANEVVSGERTWEDIEAEARGLARADVSLRPEQLFELDSARGDLASMWAEAQISHEQGLGQVDIARDRQMDELAQAMTERRRQEMHSLGGRGMAFQNRGRGMADRFREDDRRVAHGQIGEWEQEQINQLAQALSGAGRQHASGEARLESLEALWQQQAIEDALRSFGTFAV